MRTSLRALAALLAYPTPEQQPTRPWRRRCRG